MLKKLGITKTTFSNLEVRYEQIFSVSFSETPQGQLDHKKGREVLAKIRFFDDTCYLQCREIFDNNNLVEYYYDWYAGNDTILQKFHAHYHPNDTPEEVKKFDPWHWHVPKDEIEKDGQRVPSKEGYTIDDVLEEHVLPHILRLKRSKK